MTESTSHGWGTNSHVSGMTSPGGGTMRSCKGSVSHERGRCRVLLGVDRSPGEARDPRVRTTSDPERSGFPCTRRDRRGSRGRSCRLQSDSLRERSSPRGVTSGPDASEVPSHASEVASKAAKTDQTRQQRHRLMRERRSRAAMRRLLRGRSNALSMRCDSQGSCRRSLELRPDSLREKVRPVTVRIGSVSWDTNSLTRRITGPPNRDTDALSGHASPAPAG